MREWAERAGFPQDHLLDLAGMLEKSTPKAKKALGVFHRNGLLFFKNTRAVIVGTSV